MSTVISRVRSLITSDEDDQVETLEASEPAVELSVDDAFAVLSNERRRLAVRFVSEHDARVFELNDIVRFIASEQHGDDFDSMERKRVYIAMYQTHVEQLVDAGVIEVVSDGEAHTYRQGEAAERLSSLLTTADDVLEVNA